MTRRKIDGLRAILTGCSSGIGWQLAHELTGRGAKLVASARREQRLADLRQQISESGGTAVTVVGDVTDPAHRQMLLDVAKQQFGGLDLLINNAGVGAIGPFADASESRLRRVMEVDFFAAVELIRAALPLLEEGRRPMIVNVSSVLGHRAVPHKSEYCAAKFALHGFSDALRAELVGTGIDVLLISPSTTRTEFFDNVLETKAKLPWLEAGAQSPVAVARAIVRAIRKGRQEIILTPGGKALVWADRLCPPLVNRLVAYFAKSEDQKS